MLEYIILALLMLITGFVVDVVWALYVKYIASGNRLRAAMYSIVSGMCTIVFVSGAITSLWLTPFWLIGLGLGTYFSTDVEKYVIKYVSSIRI